MMHVPLYVYFLFLGLLYIGIKRCFSRVIKTQRLFLSPICFTLLSVRGMLTLFEITPFDFSFWTVGCAAGIVFGYLHVKNNLITASHQKQLIQLPGDWSILCLIMLVFSIEFSIHYSIQARWPITETLQFKYVSLALLGIIAGTSIGRTLHYYLKYTHSKNANLI
jgi:hypothetical protein